MRDVRPGRLDGNWKPELGLDLQGGTRITLTANGEPDRRRASSEAREHHRPARQRLRRRRGRGDHPGRQVHRRRDPRRQPSRPRRDGEAPGAAAVPGRRVQRLRRPLRHLGDRPSSSPAQPEVPADGATGLPDPSGEPSGEGGNNRAPVSYADKKDKKHGQERPAGQPSESPSGSSPTAGPRCPTARTSKSRWSGWTTPTPSPSRRFQEFTCPPAGEAPLVEDDPDKPLVTCDEQGSQVPPLRVDDRGHRPQVGQRRHPAAERRLGRRPGVRRRRHRQVHRDLADALRHREAVRDRARRHGHLGADHERHHHQRSGADHR